MRDAELPYKLPIPFPSISRRPLFAVPAAVIESCNVLGAQGIRTYRTHNAGGYMGHAVDSTEGAGVGGRLWPRLTAVTSTHI